MAKRKPSERTLFERWYHSEYGASMEDIRAARSEAGYEWTCADCAWMAWQARAEVNE